MRFFVFLLYSPPPFPSRNQNHLFQRLYCFCRECLVRWKTFNIVDGYHQYFGGIPSILWGIFGTVGDYFITVQEYHLYYRGRPISTLKCTHYRGGYDQYPGCSIICRISLVLKRDNISNLEDIQYCGGITSVMQGIPYALWS